LGVVAAKLRAVAAKFKIVATKLQAIAAKFKIVATKLRAVAAKFKIVATKFQAIAAKLGMLATNSCKNTYFHIAKHVCPLSLRTVLTTEGQYQCLSSKISATVSICMRGYFTP
jgi:hydroxymethylpyrimidine/phosphomethylpyrimidine kinase